MSKVLAAAVLSATTALAGCTEHLPREQAVPTPVYYGPVPISTATPADEALRCLSQRPEVQRSGKMYAVHLITDQTNRFSSDDVGGYVPRDSAGMMVSLLQKTGVNQVNRSNTAVSEWEIERAREQILGDGGPVSVGNQTVEFRPLLKGALRGSDYVIDGAITQLDFNTYSSGAEATVGGLGGGRRVFAVTVGLDLRVTDTKSTRIVKAESYTKQAVGHEVFLSVFRFFSSEMFDVKIGDKSQEGLQAGVRWVLAEAAYDIVSSLSGHDGYCDQFLPDATREVRGVQAPQIAALPPPPLVTK